VTKEVESMAEDDPTERPPAEMTPAQVLAEVLERFGKVAGAVEDLKTGMTDLRRGMRILSEEQSSQTTRMDRMERARAHAAIGDDALQSQHEIDMGFRKDFMNLAASIKADLQELGASLKEDMENRRKAEADERRQESIAAKKLIDDKAAKDKEAADKRDFLLKLIAIVVPVATVLITGAYGAFVAIENQRFREDTAAQYRSLSQRSAPAFAPYEPATPLYSPPPASSAPPRP
jgi:hypothetical protein